MGSLLSKGVTGAARRYPSRPDVGVRVPSAVPKPEFGGSVASSPKDKAIAEDSVDPDNPSKAYADRLHTMGVAKPSVVAPHISRSVAASENPTLSALQARRTLELRADAAGPASTRDGRPEGKLVSIQTILHMISLREQGATAKDVDLRLKLPPGTADLLGPRSVVSLPSASGGRRDDGNKNESNRQSSQ